MDEPWRVTPDPVDKILTRLVYWTRGRRRRLQRLVTLLFGVEVPTEVQVGTGLILKHSTGGFVLHPRTRIGNNVTIYQRVTVGRADVWQPHPADWPGFVIEDEAILAAGAVIVAAGDSALVVAEGSVVGANSVLTTSTGPWEIWAGVPARKVAERPR